MAIGKQIKHYRTARGLTLEQLEDLSGVATGTISALETRDSSRSSYFPALAKALGLTVEQLADTSQTFDANPAGESFPEGRRIHAIGTDDPIPDGIVLIKESRVRFSAGGGAITPHYEEIEESLPASYRRAWIISEGMHPAKLRRFQVKGRSMEPVLFDGDSVLVNMAETEVRDGQVYAIRYGDEMRVKRLYRRIDGGVILRSDNPEYSPEEIPASLVDEHIQVIGRVREKSGKGGL